MTNLQKGYVVPGAEIGDLGRNTGWRRQKLAMFLWVALGTSPVVHAKLHPTPERKGEINPGLEIYAGAFDTGGKPLNQTWANTCEFAIWEEMEYHLAFDLHLRAVREDDGYYLLFRPATQPYTG